MAVISHKYKFIYILNPRTASTATAHALRNEGEGINVPENPVVNDAGKILAPSKHTSIRQLQQHNIVDEETLKSYFKFVTVRNPYDSVVSAWAKKTNDYIARLDNPKSWIHKKPGYADSIRQAVGKSFSEWVADTYPEKIANGEVGSINRKYVKGTDSQMRYENLQEDFEAIKAKVGLPSDLYIPQINITAGRDGEKDYHKFYDDRSRELVAEYFKQEIELLGYEF